MSLTGNYALGEPHLGQHQLMDRRTLRRLSGQVRSVIETAVGIVEGSALDLFNPFGYVELPKAHSLLQTIHFNGRSLLASARDKESTDSISAFRVMARTYNAASSEPVLNSDIEHLVALLTVLVGQSVKQGHIEWPRGQNRQLLYSGPRQVKSFYPGRRYLYPDPSGTYSTDVTSTAQTALEILAKTSVNQNPSLWRAILAYSSGISLHSKEPTLASVAFIATLNSLVEKKHCPGKVTCSECGARPSHPEPSEPNAVANSMIKDLSIEGDDAGRVTRLLKRVYREQRSAYVHDAVLRHSELGQGRGGATMRPSTGSINSDGLLSADDLMSISHLARRVLLVRLSPLSDGVSQIQERLGNHLFLSSGVGSLISIGRQPTGLRLPEVVRNGYPIH